MAQKLLYLEKSDTWLPHLPAFFPPKNQGTKSSTPFCLQAKSSLKNPSAFPSKLQFNRTQPLMAKGENGFTIRSFNVFQFGPNMYSQVRDSPWRSKVQGHNHKEKKQWRDSQWNFRNSNSWTTKKFSRTQLLRGSISKETQPKKSDLMGWCQI